MIQPSLEGKGYARTPGIHLPEQIAAWRLITNAVHVAGGKIVAQLMHCGRVASRHNKPPLSRTVAPSAVRANVEIFSDSAGVQPCDMPEPLALADIPRVIAEHADAARAAGAAGFDGVELHVTSGYLPMQFLAANTNLRQDAYGGDASRRARFVIETLEAISAAIGPGRCGARICAGNPFNDVKDPDPLATYDALLPALAGLRLGWLHVIGSRAPGFDGYAHANKYFAGRMILNDGFKADSANQSVLDGTGAAVSFGRYFMANPDLVRRIRECLPLAAPDPQTFYTPGAAGYTDYPNAP